MATSSLYCLGVLDPVLPRQGRGVIRMRVKGEGLRFSAMRTRVDGVVRHTLGRTPAMASQ
jgi:hypothetical protein